MSPTDVGQLREPSMARNSAIGSEELVSLASTNVRSVSSTVLLVPNLLLLAIGWDEVLLRAQ